MALEFLDLIETVRANDVSETRLYRGEGIRARRKQVDTRYHEKFDEALALYSRVLAGDRWAALTFQEALTTSDFPLLFGDILDRALLGAYQEAPYTWNMIAKAGSVADFRQVKRFAIDGSEAVLPEVLQQAPYPGSSLSETRYLYSVSKHGRRIPFSWETMLNDDLDALKDIPNRYGKAARRSEEKFVTQLFAGATGPDATFFTVAHGNVISPSVNSGVSDTNTALSIAGLQDAFIILASQVDTEGEPIAIDGVTLVVPPALEVTAQNLLNATEILVGTFPTTGSNQQIRAVNWLAKRVKLAVNYYLPIVSPTNGNTSWYLFADPNAGRPALEFGKLRGHENPEIFIKTPNAQRVGGGMINPLDGDFDTDSIEYKVRHCFGGTTMEVRMAVASNGTGN